MERNPPRSPFVKGGGRTECTKYRDLAQARLESGPPDAGFYRSPRRRWRDRVSRLARCLDALDPDDATLGPILRLAFRVLLPLIDPGWWDAHPKARLNAEARRLLRGIDKWRRALGGAGGRKAARDGRAESALGRLQLEAFGAAAIYARHGDSAALGQALRLIDVLDEALAGAGAEVAGGRNGAPDSPSGGRKPAARGTRGRHDAGAADAASGKEDDV